MAFQDSIYKTIIGIDNGVTGTIGIIGGANGTSFFKTPIKKKQDYTKKKKIVSKIDHILLREMFEQEIIDPTKTICIIERPMVNPGRFTATLSAMRALDRCEVVIEDLKLPHIFCDSKEWQKTLLPKGCKGLDLKVASHDIGIRLFPQFEELIAAHKDADGILIAEYGRRIYF